MTDFTCVIVDDEPIARDILRQFVSDAPGLNLVGECSNALELIEILKKKRVDLIFLDINMPKLSGIDFLRSQTVQPNVILTTAYPEFALDGYELNVVDYLLKPIAFPRFLQAVDKVKKVVDKRDVSFTVKTDGRSYRIDVADIRFVESKGDYLQFHLNEQKITVYMTMKKLMELSQERIIRVHKSYAVSISAVDYVEGNLIHIGDSEIPIGASYKEDFKQRWGD
ncbi:MAG: response regulator transcription factor [Balneolaceae bacterium]|nr:response regulator transcription factor [Balneolaceae bacterium]